MEQRSGNPTAPWERLDSASRSDRTSAPAVRDRIGSSELHRTVEDSDYKVVSHRRRFPRKCQKTMHTIPALGIDIAKDTFAAALWIAGRYLKKEFRNNPSGFRALCRWLQQHFAGSVRVGLESTSTYAEALAEWMHGKGHMVYLLNPERTAYYARCLGQRNKTDPADAVTIAQFVAAHSDLTVWQPLPPEQKDLRSLTRVRQQLVETRVALENQLKTATGPGHHYLAQTVAKLKADLKQLDRAIAAHIKKHPRLAELARRLMTTPGVGVVLASVSVAELPPITAQTDPRAICSWVGLTPRRRQSGKTELPTRISRHGNAYLRQALFMPALVAKRWNPVLKTFAQRLKENGKSSTAILGAVAHKLLRILVGLLRSNTDFDPNWSPQKI